MHLRKTWKLNRIEPSDVPSVAVEKLRHLISGVVVHVPGGVNEHAAELVSVLARLRSG